MGKSCIFIGAGNLASKLSVALFRNGVVVKQVYNRTEQKAKELAGQLNCAYTSNLSDIEPNADVCFVTLKDSVYEDVLTGIDFQNQLVVHCSGSMPLSSLEKYSENRGVFYPLQTFSKNREINFREIPVFLESDRSENLEILKSLASKISDSVQLMDSEKRMYLHVSAVFACNFVNHMYTIASRVLKRKDIPFEVLRPLILETSLKVMENEPEIMQTGPAIRYDRQIIEKHLDALKETDNFAGIYNGLTESIFAYYSAKK